MAAHINASELRNGTVFEEGGSAFVVIKYEHIKKARAQAVIRVKVKDIKTGSVTEKTYSSNNKVSLADIMKRSAQYTYSDGNELYFMDSTSYDQFSIESEALSFNPLLLKEGQKVIVEYLDNQPISVEAPKTVELEVVEAPEAVASGTVSNPSKSVKLETGLMIDVPMFVSKGDIIKINTEDTSYITRV